MKRPEILTRAMLALLAAAAVTAVIIQIINEKTNTLETMYEIITFSVSITALIMAVLQGLKNAKISQELHKIASETHASLLEARRIDQGEMEIDREIREVLNKESVSGK